MCSIGGAKTSGCKMYREMVPVMTMKLVTLLHCPRRQQCRNTHSTVRQEKIKNVSAPTLCSLATELCMYVIAHTHHALFTLESPKSNSFDFCVRKHMWEAESKLKTISKEVKRKGKSKLKASYKQAKSKLKAS